MSQKVFQLDSGRKLIAYFLVFSLLTMSCSTIKATLRGKRYDYQGKKPGIMIRIHKKDNQKMRGELIAVKKESLLLLDYKSGTDINIDIGDINIIGIEKKSKLWKGAGYGFLIGGVIGLALGGSESKSGDSLTLSPGPSVGFYIIFIGVFGALIGGVAGSNIRDVEEIQVKGKSKEEIQSMLENLRKKARVPDYQ